MGRPGARLVLIAALLAPLAAAQSLSDHQEDPRDDVVGSLYADQPDLPHLDILFLDGSLGSGVLEATLRLAAGPPPLPDNRSLDYLLLVDHQEGRGPAFGYGDWDTQIRCTVVDGTLPVDACAVTGNATVEAVSLDGDRVSWRLSGLTADRLGLGAGATQAASDGSSVVDGFDFTTNADPFAVYRGIERDAKDDGPGKPWWQSGWILVTAGATGAAFAIGRNLRRRRT